MPNERIFEPYNCCGITFRDPKNFAEHYLSRHPDKPLMCCHTTFVSAQDYSRHQTVDHTSLERM